MVCAVDTAQPSQAAATQGSGAQRQTISQLVPGIQQALLLARVSALTFGELEPCQIFADLDLEVHIPASLQRDWHLTASMLFQHIDLLCSQLR